MASKIQHAHLSISDVVLRWKRARSQSRAMGPESAMSLQLQLLSFVAIVVCSLRRFGNVLN